MNKQKHITKGKGMDFNNIEIIVSEVDGIVTNDLNYLDGLNNTILKSFYVSDFEIINTLKSYFTFVFLSSDPSISYNVMRSRNIPFYFTKDKKETKVDILNKILRKYNTSPENLIYVGNKLSDIDCMQLAEFSITTHTAVAPVRKEANYIAPVYVGKDRGVISSVYDLLYTNKSKFNY